MMHHFGVVIPKSVQAEADLPRRLSTFIRDWCVFASEEIILHRIGERTVLFSCSTNNASRNIRSPVKITDDCACAVAGCPTFEQFFALDSAAPDPAGWMMKVAQQHSMDELWLKIGGTFSAAVAGPQKVSGIADSFGYNSLFYLDTEEYVAISNRPSILAALQTSGPFSRINRRAIAWTFSTTMIIGYETPWDEVHRVPTGQVVEIAEQSVHFRKIDDPNVPSGELDVGSRQRYIADCMEDLVRRYQWHMRYGNKFESHLTGGKDSRVNIALMKAAGVIDNVEAITTHGTEDNGDVVIARRVAAALGLRNHTVSGRGKSAVKDISWSQYVERFQYSPWKYNMYLTPYDGTGGPATRIPHAVTFMGGGGEIYRQKGIVATASQEFDVVTKRFEDWYYKFDVLNVLDSEVHQTQRDFISAEVAGMIRSGVRNLQPAFYIQHRMANWGNGHFVNNPSPSTAALLDRRLAAVMQTSHDLGDGVYYELLKRSAPELLLLPLLNDSWAVPETDTVELPPSFTWPRAKSFPWQFALYEQCRNDLIDYILGHRDVWQGILAPEKLLLLRDTPVKPFNASHVKMLFALVAATNFLYGNLRRNKDFAAQVAEPEWRGNLSAALSRSVADGEASKADLSANVSAPLPIAGGREVCRDTDSVKERQGMKLSRNEDSWISPEKTGASIPPYQPTFPFAGFINANHKRYSGRPGNGNVSVATEVGIPGHLRREDALKLYEMAYYAQSDILELGTGNGLSTSIMAQAIEDSDKRLTIVTVDVSLQKTALAKRSLSDMGLENCVELRSASADAACEEFEREGRKFGFIFVDHSHAYNHVYNVCLSIPHIVDSSGFCLFHDFNDKRNLNLSDENYGVSRAVLATVGSHRDFAFYGIFGCTALYRKE